MHTNLLPAWVTSKNSVSGSFRNQDCYSASCLHADTSLNLP
jgi:hypothetical protein